MRSWSTIKGNQVNDIHCQTIMMKSWRIMFDCFHPHLVVKLMSKLVQRTPPFIKEGVFKWFVLITKQYAHIHIINHKSYFSYRALFRYLIHPNLGSFYVIMGSYSIVSGSYSFVLIEIAIDKLSWVLIQWSWLRSRI